MPPPTTQLSLADKLGALDPGAATHAAPFADRINTLTAQSTQPLSDQVMRDNPIKQIAQDTLKSFPFTDEAKGKLKDLNYHGVDSTGFGGDVQNTEGTFNTRGAGIYHAANTILPDALSTWIAKKASFLNAPSIKVSASIKDPHGVMAHEMLHDLFESSPMGNKAFVADGKDPGKEAQAGQAWLGAWDAVKKNDTDIGPLLAHIDEHLVKSGYHTSDPFEVANERFAYLGQEALKYGINVIPKELQPYYYGVINGAPAPTPEQLGAGLAPDQGFNIDIGNTPESRSESGAQATQPPPLADRIYNLLAGRTTFDNPNAGGTPPPAPALGHDAFTSRIVGVENAALLASGGDLYRSVGKKTPDLGKYQVSPASLKTWGSSWLGKNYTKAQFLADPAAQETFFKTFLTSVVDKYNLTPEQAAVAWHTGWGAINSKTPTKAQEQAFLRGLGTRMTGKESKNYLTKFNAVKELAAVE